MRKALLDVLAAIAGGLATYAVTLASSSLGPAGKLTVSATGALAALALALWAGRSRAGRSRAGRSRAGHPTSGHPTSGPATSGGAGADERSVDIGSDVNGRDGIRIEDVSAPAGIRRLSVGARARSRGTVVIKGIHVGARRDGR